MTWYAGHILAAILPFLVILSIAAVSLRAQPPAASSANPAFVHALYIVKVDRVVKLKAVDGVSLFEITDAQELRRADVEGHADTPSTNTLLANNLSVDNGINSPRTKGNLRVDSMSGTALDYDQLFLSQAGQVTVVWDSTNYSSLSSFVAATGKEPHGLAADPRWVAPALGDFHLMAATDSAASGASHKDLESNPRVDDPATPNAAVGPRTYDDPRRL